MTYIAPIRDRIGDEYFIIRNDGTDPVIGTFANYPQGSRYTDSNGVVYEIDYAGGDGNDVTWTVVDPASPTSTLIPTAVLTEIPTEVPTQIPTGEPTSVPTLPDTGSSFTQNVSTYIVGLAAVLLVILSIKKINKEEGKE